MIAGNWPWWLIESGRTGTLVQFAKVDSGTWSPVGRRLDVDLVQRVEAALQLRQDFQDHVIAVELGEILRRPGAGRTRRTACRRSAAAGCRSARRCRGRSSASAWCRWSAGRSRRRAARGSVCILARIFGAHSFSSSRLASCSVIFELRAGRPAAEPDVLRRLHEEPGALDLVELGAQPRDDLLRGGVALVARLQRDEHAAVVAGAGRCRRSPWRRWRRRDRPCTILPSSSWCRFMSAKEMSCAGFGGAGDQAGILLREEALRE